MAPVLLIFTVLGSSVVSCTNVLTTSGSGLTASVGAIFSCLYLDTMRSFGGQKNYMYILTAWNFLVCLGPQTFDHISLSGTSNKSLHVCAGASWQGALSSSVVVTACHRPSWLASLCGRVHRLVAVTGTLCPAQPSGLTLCVLERVLQPKVIRRIPQKSKQACHKRS